MSSFYEFEFDPTQCGNVTARQFIDNELTEEVFCLSQIKGNCARLPTLTEFPAYNAKLPINNLKLADLAKVKQYVPTEFSTSFEEILQWPSSSDPEPPEEDF